MTPLLFPFTYVAPEAMARAARFFPHLTVYQPVGGRLPDELQPWVGNGFLKIRVPVPDDDDKILAAADEYQSWARQHQPGSDIRTLLTGAGPRPPLFDDSSPSQILAELKAGRRDPAGSASRLFSARLFLCLAQQLDLDDQEIWRRLTRAEADSNSLMAELKPGDGRESFSGPGAAAFEPGPDFMLPERLAAWTQLFLADRLTDVLLLTTSPAVFAEVIQGRDKARLLARLNSGEGSHAAATAADSRQASFLAEIESAALNSRQVPEAEGAPFFSPDESADLMIYLVPDAAPRPFLAGLSGVSSHDPAGTPPTGVIVGFLNSGTPAPLPA